MDIYSIDKKQLIVLVPDSLAGNLELARKIHWMALQEQCNIFYLVLVDDLDRMLSVSRSTTTMVAISSGSNIHATSKLVRTSDWLSTLKSIHQPGDSIVCHNEQTAKQGLLKTIPLSTYLGSAFQTNVKTLSGFYHPHRIQIRQMGRGLLAWTGFLLIVIGFSFLEIKMDHALTGLSRTVILGLLLCLEFATAFVWNNKVNR